MTIPAGHVADHWAIYLIYSVPILVVIGAIVTSALRERRRKADRPEPAAGQERPISREAPRDADRGSP